MSAVPFSPSASLLIELLTEELPPHALSALADAFSQTLVAELDRLQLLPSLPTNGHDCQVFATPRRLAVVLRKVSAVQPLQRIERRGPVVPPASQGGRLTQALSGFARSCGVAIDALETRLEGKQSYYFYYAEQPGQTLSALLPEVLQRVVPTLPIPKLMRWGTGQRQFARPVHGLVVLHGATLLDCEWLGLRSGRHTYGHRFLAPKAVDLQQADSYAKQLYEEGRVVCAFSARRTLMDRQLMAAAESLQATIAAPQVLYDEVAALVEWPAVYVGRFDARFLEIPPECLMLSMRQHQKYFPLLDAEGRLMPAFLMVSNLEPEDPASIIEGNERVLRARLSDARFFYEQDVQETLESRVPRLADVLYHHKLGSQLARSERVQQIAIWIAQMVAADQAVVARAAWLAKADLLCQVVGEFPELQGTMGRYYALRDGEPEAVADAIEAHYWPRFSGEALPGRQTAQVVALADKVETLTGIFGIGQSPTGDKDPFALRRAALGVARLLTEAKLPIDLLALLQVSALTFGSLLSQQPVDKVYRFILERLRHAAMVSFEGPVVDAVLATHPTRLEDFQPRMVAIAAFGQKPEAAALIAADKRIRHLLKNRAVSDPVPPENATAAALTESAECALFAALKTAASQVEAALCRGEHLVALEQMAVLAAPVGAFFAEVLVLVDELDVRQRRLALLAQVSALFNRVAQLACLAE